MSASRDLAEAIHHEIISPDSVDAALDIWREMPMEHPEWDERKRIWFLLAAASHEATEAVLARRQSEAARTGPWNASGCACPPTSEKTCKGPLCPRRGIGAAGQWGDYTEEDGYPGSLVPRKRGTP